MSSVLSPGQDVEPLEGEVLGLRRYLTRSDNEWVVAHDASLSVRKRTRETPAHESREARGLVELRLPLGSSPGTASANGRESRRASSRVGGWEATQACHRCCNRLRPGDPKFRAGQRGGVLPACVVVKRIMLERAGRGALQLRHVTNRGLKKAGLLAQGHGPGSEIRAHWSGTTAGL